MNHHSEPERAPSNSAGKYLLIAFLVVAGFFLVTEHRAHLFGILPYLLLAACPLMHFFGHGHGGHGRHGEKESKSGQRAGDKPPEPPEHPRH
ncbi:MAG: DUF2933 domain-containing protein [Burkholderiales bacterium]